MRWNRQSVKALGIAFVVVVATSFFIKFTFDHDGETFVAFDDDSTTATPARDDVETGDTDPETGLAWILASDLPVEASATLALIDQGGPFPYPGKDGSTFENRERLLPDRPNGYYAEYTVPTPGEDDRGARRVITGDRGEFFWTADHYETFSRILRDAA